MAINLGDCSESLFRNVNAFNIKYFSTLGMLMELFHQFNDISHILKNNNTPLVTTDEKFLYLERVYEEIRIK